MTLVIKQLLIPKLSKIREKVVYRNGHPLCEVSELLLRILQAVECFVYLNLWHDWKTDTEQSDVVALTQVMDGF